MSTKLEQIPTFAGMASWNPQEEDSQVTDKLPINGESDGTRTRDLRRDRPTTSLQKQYISNFQGVFSGHKSKESWNCPPLYMESDFASTHASPGEASNSTQHPLKSHNISDLNPSLVTTGFSGEGFRS